MKSSIIIIGHGQKKNQRNENPCNTMKKRGIFLKFKRLKQGRYDKMKTDELEEEAGRDFIDRNTEGAQTLR